MDEMLEQEFASYSNSVKTDEGNECSCERAGRVATLCLRFHMLRPLWMYSNRLEHASHVAISLFYFQSIFNFRRSRIAAATFTGSSLDVLK